MRKYMLLALMAFSFFAKAQTANVSILRQLQGYTGPVLIDFNSYEKLVKEVKKHRQSHLVPLDSFNKLSKQPGVIILDTRSDSMYAAKHIKGAIHLNFSDFNMYTLARLIPDTNTKVLIYCNNNFNDDQVNFTSKMARPLPNRAPITLALNIPTYINLYGYGYKNVYELSETVSVWDRRLIFEGTAVEEEKKLTKQ